ncbi:Endoribonuclease L-PSP [Coniochaeta hoffmannii]|uniref:Endoribonuclease L-PSP n=1 Tax=Coniochaeta hoffmannii TaxID=91930 RepID=A0AA38RY11_9PEZI|nr:Endoribonuclease L-PSP [Coniochaeta hoffmannii]
MGSIAMPVRPRTRTQIKNLPSFIPQVPEFEGEDKIDAKKEAETFLGRLSTSVKNGDWQGFAELFIDDAFWKESLSLTFDKRTFHGKDAITQAWKALSPSKQPSDFAVTAKYHPWLPLDPEFQRMGPTMATLDVPFTFSTANPSAHSAGFAKLIPVDGGKDWKIWILSTAMRSLANHPHLPLPRNPSPLLQDSQRGQSRSQGLPIIDTDDTPLDAVVIGGSTSGLNNAIMLEALGAKTICLTREPEIGDIWSRGRYEGLTTHNPRAVMELPYFPFPSEGYGAGHDEVLDAARLQRYYQAAVRELKLPVFAGVEVVRNEWDDGAKLWRVTARDVQSGEEKTYRAKNIVLSTGWCFPSDAPSWPDLKNRHLFKGPVQHSVAYRTAAPFKGKSVVVVGAGPSGHDVAHSLVSGGAGSVALVQRSPVVLLDYEASASVQFAPYIKCEAPTEAIDFLQLNMPLGVARDVARMRMGALIASREEMNKKLEGVGYVLNRTPDVLTMLYEQRGHGFYPDQPKTFPLVFEGKIKIERGGVTGFTEDGVVVKDRDTGEERVVPAEGVVFATGYECVDLNKKYAETGFFDAQTAAALENVTLIGSDDEGELVGYATYSGHPNLYFSGANGSIARYMARLVALQVMASASGEFPGRYQEAERYPKTPTPMYKS